jgi:hypothetical protein
MYFSTKTGQEFFAKTGKIRRMPETLSGSNNGNVKYLGNYTGKGFA